MGVDLIHDFHGLNPTRGHIISALQLLRENPHQGKPLVGPLSGKFSWRVGDYRIIYSIAKSILQILVINIGHRKNVYGD